MSPEIYEELEIGSSIAQSFLPEMIQSVIETKGIQSSHCPTPTGCPMPGPPQQHLHTIWDVVSVSQPSLIS
jgi:hypothetical protein